MKNDIDILTFIEDHVVEIRHTYPNGDCHRIAWCDQTERVENGKQYVAVSEVDGLNLRDCVQKAMDGEGKVIGGYWK